MCRTWKKLKKKLELNWPTKNNSYVWDENSLDYKWVPKNHVLVNELRILEKIKHYGKKITKPKNYSKSKRNFDNMLIHGDNLLALKSLEPNFIGKIKLIYIDPPFRTGQAFENYDDGLEHSIWLSVMKDRLEVLRKLLSSEGVIFIHIDNHEIGHLKALMDEIFFERNFVQLISVERSSAAGFKTINPGPLTVTDYILMYAKNKDNVISEWKNQYIATNYDENYDLYILNPTEPPEKWKFKKIHDIIYEKWKFKNWKDAKKAWGADWKVVRSSLAGAIALENAERVVSIRDPHKPSDEIKTYLQKSKQNPDKVFVMTRKKYEPIYFLNGGSLSFYNKKIKEIDGVLTPTKILTDLWTDLNFAGIAKEGNVVFKNSKKPEMLLKRIIEMSSKPGDWVLDSFLGSGTTAAVAHKLGRKWIGIELGDHAKTHCLPRLQDVISGKDQTGISKKVQWKGGGNFSYYELGDSVFKQDDDGYIMMNLENKNLIESVCINQGFKYVPDSLNIPQNIHGKIGLKRFCHVATSLVTQNYVDILYEDLLFDQSLVIYCTKHMSNLNLPENVEIKKIPRDIIKGYDFNSNH